VPPFKGVPCPSPPAHEANPGPVTHTAPFTPLCSAQRQDGSRACVSVLTHTFMHPHAIMIEHAYACLPARTQGRTCMYVLSYGPSPFQQPRCARVLRVEMTVPMRRDEQVEGRRFSGLLTRGIQHAYFSFTHKSRDPRRRWIGMGLGWQKMLLNAAYAGARRWTSSRIQAGKLAVVSSPDLLLLPFLIQPPISVSLAQGSV
jgi:hypothetical protein